VRRHSEQREQSFLPDLKIAGGGDFLRADNAFLPDTKFYELGSTRPSNYPLMLLPGQDARFCAVFRARDVSPPEATHIYQVKVEGARYPERLEKMTGL
jgi:hypothetical protein